MKAASTVATAYAVLPKICVSIRIQTTSYTSAAAPERKKQTNRAAIIVLREENRSVMELEPEPDRRRGKDQQRHGRAAEPLHNRLELRRRDRLAAVRAAHKAERHAHALIRAEENEDEGEQKL